MVELPATKLLSRLLGYASLVAIVVIAVMFLAGSISLDQLKNYSMIVTAVWFVAAALWMWKDNGN